MRQPFPTKGMLLAMTALNKTPRPRSDEGWHHEQDVARPVGFGAAIL